MRIFPSWGLLASGKQPFPLVSGGACCFRATPFSSLFFPPRRVCVVSSRPRTGRRHFEAGTKNTIPGWPLYCMAQVLGHTFFTITLLPGIIMVGTWYRYLV